MYPNLLFYLEQIHNITSTSDLFNNIQRALQDLLSVTTFQIYFLDETSNTLNLFFSSNEISDTITVQTAKTLETELLLKEQDFFVAKNPSEQLISAGKLQFQDSIYGCLAIYSEIIFIQKEQLETFEAIIRAANPEIIKMQLLESSSQEAQLSLSKLNGMHASINLIKSLDLDTILVRLMDLALKTMKAEVGSIMILENSQLITKVDFGLSHEIAAQLKTLSGESYLNLAMQNKEATLILNAKNSEELNTSELAVNLNSIISVPLRIDHIDLGLLHIINYEENFDSNSFEVLKTICNLSSYSLQNAILHKLQLEATRLKESMQIAQNIQSGLLIQPDFVDCGLEVYGWNCACDETGGDYFDAFFHNNESLEIIVGDASGHGIGAAMTMLITRTSLKTLYQQSIPKSDMFYILNNRLVKDVSDERFMTLFCGSICYKTKTLSYISAGHDGPLLYRPNEPIQELESTGIPIGMLEDYPYEEIQTIPLKKGDILLLGSDGTWEAMNEENIEYGKENMLHLIRKNTEKSAKEIVDYIKNDILSHVGSAKIRDDMTLIVIKVLE